MVGSRRDYRIGISTGAAFGRAGSEDFFFGDIINICRNGFFMKTETILPVDTELKLRIRLPEDIELLDITGRVVWAKQASSVAPAGMGIEFVQQSAEAMNIIAHFVDARRQDQNLSAEPAGEHA
jgi:uncharacterized protein (TIGR02266 family)